MKKFLLLNLFIGVLLCSKLFAATPPPTLTMTGSAVKESGEPIPMKLQDNVYELYTSLQSGTYSFPEESSITEQTLDSEGVYRIRVDYSGENPAFSLQKIEQVYIWAPNSGKTLAILAYEGNGIFKKEDIVCEDPDAWFNQTGWGERRYRLRINFEGAVVETYAPKGGSHFVLIGNKDWDEDDFNYELDNRYRNDKVPFTFTAKFQVAADYDLFIEDYIAPGPETMSITGTALAESETMVMKKISSIFEIYTSLQNGDYSFVGDNVTGGTIAEGEEGVYRVRVSYATNPATVSVQKIEQVYIWAPNSGNTLATLAYEGNGVFKKENIVCEDPDAWFNQTSWGERRYRLRINFEGAVVETYAPKDGSHFVLIGNEQWDASDFNYELTDKYRNNGVPFTFIAKFPVAENYDLIIEDYIAPAPETLSITGTALAESTEAMVMKKTGNIFEIYTSLQNGDYSFIGDNITGGIITEGEEGVYRIRVNYATNPVSVTAQKIEKIYMWAPWTQHTIVGSELTYAGNSSFEVEKLFCDKPTWGFSEVDEFKDIRYRFRMEFEGDVMETYGPKDGDFGLIGNGQWGDENNYNYSMDAKYKGSGIAFNVTLTLAPDADYTHTVTDYIAPTPESLSVQGTALAESTEAMVMKKTGNIFEIYTSLQNGDYSFVGDDVAGGTIAEGEEGVYRIRVNYATNPVSVTAQKIERVYVWYPWTKTDIVDLSYAGNSVFTATSVLFNKATWGYEENENVESDIRYRFRMIVDGAMETYGPKDGNFTLIGNGQWGTDNDHNYALDAKYKETGVAFDLELTLKANEEYSQTVTENTNVSVPNYSISTVAVYPTLVTDHLTIATEKAGFAVELISITGTMVYQASTGADVLNLDGISLAKGIYLVKIIQEGKVLTTKRIVKN